MIISTRYRDVPFADLVRSGHAFPGYPDTQKWSQLRGTAVQIVVPPLAGRPDNAPSSCHGPFYLVLGRHRVVCPHLAEIGD